MCEQNRMFGLNCVLGNGACEGPRKLAHTRGDKIISHNVMVGIGLPMKLRYFRLTFVFIIQYRAGDGAKKILIPADSLIFDLPTFGFFFFSGHLFFIFLLLFSSSSFSSSFCVCVSLSWSFHFLVKKPAGSGLRPQSDQRPPSG